MPYPKASTVPVPALIRRGYDRAKGLGHDGLDSVRADMREILQACTGHEPTPLEADAQQRLVLHPTLTARAYTTAADSHTRDALAAVFAAGATATLIITHPWLMATVAALQAEGLDVRVVTRWIAAMTTLPEWGAPGKIDAAHPLDDADAAALACALGAARGGHAMALLPRRDALAAAAADIEGLEIRWLEG